MINIDGTSIGKAGMQGEMKNFNMSNKNIVNHNNIIPSNSNLHVSFDIKSCSANIEKNKLCDTSDVICANNLKNGSSNDSRMHEKYGLRPRTIKKRLQQEKVHQERPKRPQRTKIRPAPLSKYRRKTANARERHRMREINNAFDLLRKALPDVTGSTVSNVLTKVSTLKLAVQYIQALSNVLDDEANGSFYPVESTNANENEPKNQEEMKTSSAGQNLAPISVFSSTAGYVHNTTPTNSSLFNSRSCSVGSSSDFEELLSEDSAFLDDNFDVFHDIQPLPGPDPFDLLMEPERENSHFISGFQYSK